MRLYGSNPAQKMAVLLILNGSKLGHATDKEIEKLANTTKCSDIFDATNDSVKGKAEGYKAIKIAANGVK
ncbi:hypothetical protein [Neobacillus vireti]|uniref:hypothetical protein n=1 Tax=Neobacillus vireti TaxID=220686 RepID=UPI002FFFB640